MSDNLVLELLRAIRGDLAKLSNRMDENDHLISQIERMIDGMRHDSVAAHD